MFILYTAITKMWYMYHILSEDNAEK